MNTFMDHLRKKEECAPFMTGWREDRHYPGGRTGRGGGITERKKRRN